MAKLYRWLFCPFIWVGSIAAGVQEPKIFYVIHVWTKLKEISFKKPQKPTLTQAKHFHPKLNQRNCKHFCNFSEPCWQHVLVRTKVSLKYAANSDQILFHDLSLFLWKFIPCVFWTVCSRHACTTKLVNRSDDGDNFHVRTFMPLPCFWGGGVASYKRCHISLDGPNTDFTLVGLFKPVFT
mgnify:CR=1 FL=1